jgi:hypothetical protein
VGQGVPQAARAAAAQEQQDVRDVLLGHPLAHHIGEFLADVMNANKPRGALGPNAAT